MAYKNKFWVLTFFLFLFCFPSSAEMNESADDFEIFLGVNQNEIFSQNEGISSEFKKNPIIDLTLEKAQSLAIKNSFITRTARENIDAALSRTTQALSYLLPQLDGTLYQRRTGRENLTALGFKQGGIIGPFNTFDARFDFTQKILDLSSLYFFKASKSQLNFAKFQEVLSRQKLEVIVALDYLNALRATGSYYASKANLDLSQRLLTQSRNQLEVGIATGVDVARAETQVAQSELNVQKALKQIHEAYLELLRVIGLPFDNDLCLKNSLSFFYTPSPDLNEALELAEKKRIELQVAQEQINVSDLFLLQAKSQRLPKIQLNADYGLSGNEPKLNDHPTWRGTISANMPIFEAGQISGKIAEAKSGKNISQINYDDIKSQVEQDIYLALWAIKINLEQVNAAKKVVNLAQKELDLSNHRFVEGVGNNIEVTNAQTSLANARLDYISALTQYHISRMNMFYALGDTNSFYLKEYIPQKEQ